MQSSITESGLEGRLSTRDPALQYSGTRATPERLPLLILGVQIQSSGKWIGDQCLVAERCLKENREQYRHTEQLHRLRPNKALQSDRFARKIAPFFDRILCGALAAAERQGVRQQLFTTCAIMPLAYLLVRLRRSWSA